MRDAWMMTKKDQIMAEPMSILRFNLQKTDRLRQ